MAEQTQREKFEQAARALDCDENEDSWDVTLKRVATQEPTPDHPPAK